MTVLDLILYTPLCLAITFVWAGTREETPREIVRHGLLLFVRATIGLVLFCLAIQLLLLLFAGG